MAVRAEFVGLGHIGQPMARRIRSDGLRATVYDRRADCRRPIGATCGVVDEAVR